MVLQAKTYHAFITFDHFPVRSSFLAFSRRSHYDKGMGKHKGNQGGRRPLEGEAMTEQLTFRVPVKLAQQIDERCDARGEPERAAMIRYLLKLGIQADIRNFEVAD